MNGGKNMNNKEIITPEFVLIIVMLVVLAVLWMPVTRNDSSVTVTDLLDFRQSVLATIIMVFGAWVGNGTAYFFGCENLRETTQRMLHTPEQFLDD
jgi:hypothetical protein